MAQSMPAHVQTAHDSIGEIKVAKEPQNLSLT